MATGTPEWPRARGLDSGVASLAAGLKPVAFVTFAQDAAFDEDARTAHCAAHMAKDKLQLRVQPIDVFPMTPCA